MVEPSSQQQPFNFFTNPMGYEGSVKEKRLMTFGSVMVGIFSLGMPHLAVWGAVNSFT
jgi:hypothetical protein